MTRSRIPAEVQRAVRIQSGDRCAVCGCGAGLEFATIRPWHESGDVSGENLICLCASCHARADQQNWDEKTLRAYKDKPWVARQYERARADVSKVGVFSTRITIQIELAEHETAVDVAEFIRAAIARFDDAATVRTHVTAIGRGREDVFPRRATPDHTSNQSALKSEDSSNLDFYQDDFLLDNTGAISIASVRDRLPAIDVRGATVINAGAAHTKAPRMIACPRCGNMLKEGTAVLRFRLAPELRRMQEVEGWVCDCGEAYVPGAAAKAAHRRAFTGTSRVGDDLS